MFSRIIFAALVLSASLVTAQTSTPPGAPCSQSEFRQLDFWVGEWNLTWPAPKPGQPEGKGTNTIRRILGDCVIEENFDGGAMGLTGKSVSTFNPRSKKWQQTWVDSQGSYIDLAGEWNGQQMVLVREAVNPKGQKVRQRMTYKNVTADSFDWTWESSQDDGKTWQLLWPIHYQRKKS